MRKIQEKVRDIVEIGPYRPISNFDDDPALTLGAYCFTDATADLMARWLDRLLETGPGRGSACALAGYRGVGKSHFLAVIDVLASNPEQRALIPDQHVESSARRLMRRHYPVVRVRRGTGETLEAELSSALDATFGADASAGTAPARLEAVTEAHSDVPIVVIVDTAVERRHRVMRDDGAALAELGGLASRSSIFLAVALDDDIAAADGANSGISQKFTIDYLDQEHLYKVVNSSVFPKSRQELTLLHETYEYFREMLPGFRWSENRFAALYPLHPAILEVAPFVRLHVQDFAVLAFAAGAAERILPRPATSLIALDELFDAVEPQLREVADLVDLFDAYDRLNNEVVAKIPVLQRLQAKLVLKALLLQSLTGEGATAGSIAASMLILDEADPAKAAASVAELVRVFASAMPVEITVDARDGQDERYSFNLTANDALNRALDDAGAGLDPAAPLTAIYRWFRERFPDCSFADGAGLENGWMESELVWRGGIRRGAIGWAVEEKPVSAHPLSEKSVDWEVVIDLRRSAHDDPMPAAGVSRAFWRPGSPSDDEADAIKRFCVLTLSETLRAEFGDAVRAAAHAYSILVERTMNRSFLVDGKLVIDGFDYNFTEDAQTAGNLSALFSTMLEPLFETHFPEHPCFTDTLTEEHAVRLVSDLHHPSRKNLSEVQHFAEAFALPLGIVRSDGASLVPQTEEKLLALPLSSNVMELLSAEGEAPVELDAVAQRLAKPPWGLGREAQQLLLSSLVAARQMEYVTAKGDRINHRSLDLRIVWDDIVGGSASARGWLLRQKAGAVDWLAYR